MLLLGLCITGIAWRGTIVGRFPRCRSCGFDLSGLYPKLEVCPECGATLTARRAVSPVKRQPRRSLGVLGISLSVAAFASVALLTWSRATGFDWNSVKPVWMLLRNADSSDGLLADAALAELVQRESDDELTDDQRKRVVEMALSVQASTDRPWRVSWGDLVESAWLAGKLSHEQQQAYARHAVVLRLRGSKCVRQGDRLPLWVELEPRVGSGEFLGIRMDACGLKVGESTRTPSTVGHGVKLKGSMSSESRWRRVSGAPAHKSFAGFFQENTIDLPPGAYRVRSRWEIRVERLVKGIAPEFSKRSAGTGRWLADENWLAGAPVQAGPIVTAWREELFCDIEVVSPEAVLSLEDVLIPGAPTGDGE